MQYDLQVFVQDYRLYAFVQMIIEKYSINYSVNDDDHYYMFELNDQYHENNNHFLFDILTKNFSLIVEDFDDYVLHLFDLNDLFSKKKHFISINK